MIQNDMGANERVLRARNMKMESMYIINYDFVVSFLPTNVPFLKLATALIHCKSINQIKICEK